jgi:hypothetical protein
MTKYITQQKCNSYSIERNRIFGVQWHPSPVFRVSKTFSFLFQLQVYGVSLVPLLLNYQSTGSIQISGNIFQCINKFERDIHFIHVFPDATTHSEHEILFKCDTRSRSVERSRFHTPCPLSGLELFFFFFF